MCFELRKDMAMAESHSAPIVNGTESETAAATIDPPSFPQVLADDHIHTELRYGPLDIPAYLAFTRSPTAGANILFLGTTRDNFDHRPVSRLSYSAYPKLALKSLFAIAEDAKAKHGLEKVCIVHRLGEVKIAEESIAVAVSSGHRQAGWQGSEEILERVKARAEIWKREWFRDTGEVEEGVWRANKDRDGSGKPVDNKAA
jgi:molybdopterin synthase catalytic subunit